MTVRNLGVVTWTFATATPGAALLLPSGTYLEIGGSVGADLTTATLAEVADLAAVSPATRWGGKALIYQGAIWTFDEDSEAAAGPGVIEPSSGDGRWISTSSQAAEDASSAASDAAEALALAGGAPTAYGASGALTGARFWLGSATADGSGNWTVDLSTASFTSVLGACATAHLAAANVYDRAFASISALSTSACSGYAVRGANLAILGSTVRTAPGALVYVVVCGL